MLRPFVCSLSFLFFLPSLYAQDSTPTKIDKKKGPSLLKVITVYKDSHEQKKTACEITSNQLQFSVTIGKSTLTLNRPAITSGLLQDIEQAEVETLNKGKITRSIPLPKNGMRVQYSASYEDKELNLGTYYNSERSREFIKGEYTGTALENLKNFLDTNCKKDFF